MALNGNNAVWYSQGVDNSGLRKGREEAKKIWQDSTNDLEVETAKRGKIWQNTGKVIAAAIPIELMRRFGSEAIKVRGEFQQLEIAFGTMLKSKERADKLLYGAGGLSDFAASTPFGLQSAASGAKQLIAYGSTAETVIDELRMLGDVAAGTGQQIGDLVYLYGTLRTQGRAYMMDIRQFAGRGIPIYDELAKVLNTTKDQVNDFVSAGKVGFAEVEQAFKNMTANGGMYGGLMEEQSKSILGRIEQLKDAIGIMFNEMGKSSEGVIYNAIDGAAALVQNYEQVGKVLIGLIATYGAYRAAIIANNVVLGVQQQMLLQTALSGQALTKWQALQAVATTRLTAVTNILNKTMLANPYVLIATVLVGAATAMWALHDSTTAAERAQERYNQRLNDAKTKFDELIAIVRDETKAITDRQAALENLRRIYPGLFADMDIEAVKLANLTDLTRQATQADRDRARESAERMIAALNVDAGRQRVTIQHGSIFERRAARKRLAEIEKEIEAQEEILAREEELSKRAEEEAARSPIYGESYKAAQKEWEEAKRALTAIEKDKNAFTQKQYEDTRARVEAAKKAYADLGGDVSTGGARGGRTSDPERQAQERAALGREYENEVAQARIDAMADGLDKTLAQNALNFEREKRQIEEQYAELSATQRQALVDAAEAKKNRADSVAYSEAFAFDWDAEMASLNEYLIEYGSYQEKRLGITQKYADLIAKANGVEKLFLERQQQEALDDLDVSLAEQSELWGRLFGDVRNMSAKTLKKVIADTKALLAYLKTPKELRTAEVKPLGFTDEQLDALSGDAEKIKAIYDELIEKQDELENRSNYPFSNIVKGFGNLKKAIKGVNDEGEALTFEDQEAAKKRGLDQLSNGAVELTGFLSGAVEKMKELAELTGDSRLADFANQAGALLQNVSAAAQGAQSGGWIGAIIGGVTDMINQTVEGAAQVKAFLAEAKLNAQKFANEMRMLELDRLIGDSENIFGTNIYADVVGQAEKAAQALKGYNELIGKDTTKTAGELEALRMKNLKANSNGATVFIPFGFLWGQIRDTSNWFKAYKDTIEKGYNDLEGMLVRTKDYNGWQEFWGKQDEYKSLKEFAPNLWDEVTGEFDTEVAKKFLETVTDKQITAEQREQIQNAIELKDAYDEAMTAIEDHVKNIIGDLSSNVAEKMLDNFLAGRDILADIDDIVQDIGRNFAKTLINDKLMADIFDDNLAKNVIEMFKSGDTVGINNALKGAVEEAKALAPFIEQVAASLGLATSAAEDASRTSVNKGYSQASQDSFDKGLGIWTNMDNTLWDIRDIMRAGMPLQGFDTAAIEPVLNIAEMMRTNHSIMQANTETALGHLSAISTNTHELHAMREDLAAVREDMRLVRGLSEDIADNTEKFVR